MKSGELLAELTPRVQAILDAAASEANERGHSYVGTEHVLLALIAVGDGVASSVLDEFGVTEGVRARLNEIMQSEAYTTPG